jgi:uncharacterized integral membrane protein
MNSMPWFLLLALIISVLALIFAIQNTASVTVAFLFWDTQTPLTVVLLIALGVGAVVTFLAMLPGQIRGKWSSFSKGRRISDIESELQRSQRELQEAQSRVDELKAERDAAVAERDLHTTQSGSSDPDDSQESPL